MKREQHELTFLTVIREHPDEDSPRLAYAAWLENHDAGDGKRIALAEFIRVQCALTNPDTPAERRQLLQSRERQLLNRHRTTWERPIRALGADDIVLHRGLPEGVSMKPEPFFRNTSALFTQTPIRGLHLRVSTRRDIACLQTATPLPWLRTLDLRGSRIQVDGARTLAKSHLLVSLTTLGLDGNLVGADGAKALAKSSYLKNLRTFDLSHNYIGPDGARALAESPYLVNLTRLDLGRNAIGDEGARALAASPHLAGLTCLELRRNSIGNGGARALAKSPYLANLTRLDLRGNNIDDDGARALAESPYLAGLRELQLGEQKVTPTREPTVLDWLKSWLQAGRL